MAAGTIPDKRGNYHRAMGTIDDSRKSVWKLEKIGVYRSSSRLQVALTRNYYE